MRREADVFYFTISHQINILVGTSVPTKIQRNIYVTPVQRIASMDMGSGAFVVGVMCRITFFCSYIVNIYYWYEFLGFNLRFNFVDTKMSIFFYF